MTGDYGLVRSLDELKALVDRLGESGRTVGYDVETGYYGPDREKGALFPHEGAFVCGFSLSDSPSWARYVPTRHDMGPNLPEDEAWDIVRPLLETAPIAAHHLKFEQKMSRVHGVEVNGAACTMLQAFVLSEHPQVGLKFLTKAQLGWDQPDLASLVPGITAAKMRCFRFNILELTPEVVAYACMDAAAAVALDLKNRERAEKERGFIYRVEMAISNLMSHVEDDGIAVDWDGMERGLANCQAFIVRMEEEVKRELGEMAGRPLGPGFKLNSTKQLKELLYRDMGLTTTRETKGAEKKKSAGAADWELMSTDAIALEKLSKEHQAIRHLLDLREVQNLTKRFEKWLSYRNSRDGRVHASYAQAIVGTGRFAANEPPIQQSPKDYRWVLSDGSALEGNFRDLLKAAPGRYLLSYDYSQIELRVMAGLSQEPGLIEAFQNDEDIHTATAALMLAKPKESVSKKTERPIGKTMNFALLYGMGPQSLSERLGITLERARELYDIYFRAFPAIATWAAKLKREGKVLGYATTFMGRKYTVWELQSSNRAIYSKGERVLVNAPVQGGAADYMKVAMIRAEQALRDAGWWRTKVWLVMNQHDALTFEVDNSLSPKEVRDVLLPAVEFPIQGFPKIVSDWEIGLRWGSGTDDDSKTIRNPEGSFPIDREDGGESCVLEGGFWRHPLSLLPVGTSLESPEAKAARGVTDRDGDGQAPPTEPSEGPGLDPEVQELVEDPDAFPEVASSNGHVSPNPAANRTSPLDPKRLIIEMADMPTQDGFARFALLCSERPGVNTLTLRTPEGQLDLPWETGLTTDDQPTISIALGGARSYWAPESVDVSALTEGIDL